MPGRRTCASSIARWVCPPGAEHPLVQKLAAGQRFAPRHCARCLKGCDPAAVPYCITQALIAAVQGDVENGLFFCGSSAPRLDRMRSVRELMDELLEEWRPQA